jgi:hypothetical protein
MMKATKLNLLLGVCAKRTATAGLVISVLQLYAWDRASPRGSIPVKINVCVSYESFVQTCRIWLISDTSDRHFMGRPPCICTVMWVMFFVTETWCFLWDMHWEQRKSWLHKHENRGLSVVNISVHDMLKFSISLISIIIDWTSRRNRHIDYGRLYICDYGTEIYNCLCVLKLSHFRVIFEIINEIRRNGKSTVNAPEILRLTDIF